jgi:hypothetical protein
VHLQAPLPVVYALDTHATAMSTPIPIGQISSDVTNAPMNAVYFVLGDYTDPIYAEHTSAPKCNGVKAAAPQDSHSAGYIYELTANNESLILDTNPNYVSQSTCGQPLFTATIYATGGPGVNELVKYYESTGQTPIYYQWDGTRSNFINRANGTTIASRPNSGNGKSDYFVIEAFTDGQGNGVYIAYGFSWRGTAAANYYVAHYVVRNPDAYNASWYVFRWDDAPSGASANYLPDDADSYTAVAVQTMAYDADPPINESAAWQYFSYGNGINPNSKLPRGWIGGNWFNFWDLGMAIDGTIGAYKSGIMSQTEYQTRIGVLLSFLETMRLNSDGLPFYAYTWDSGAPAWNQSWDVCDAGRTLNALGFLSRSDANYAARIDTLLTGRLKPWIDAISTHGVSYGVYDRDRVIALTYFRYLNSQYDKSAWLDGFYTAWTSPDNRITDAYGNSMPKMKEVNLGPIAYELLEHGEDYSRTLTYASDMKSWAAKRYQATGKYSLWGSEFNVKLSDGSTPFAWEFYVALVPNVGFKTWQTKLANGQWLDENNPTLASTVSSLDAAYALKTVFPADTWVNSVFPAFEQNSLDTSSGMYAAIFESTNTPEALISIPHNAVVVLSAIPA